MDEAKHTSNQGRSSEPSQGGTSASGSDKRPAEPTRLKAQVLRLGPPASNGEVFPPGCITPADVPVTIDFDGTAVVGTAHVAEDGSAELEIDPACLGIIGDVGFGFRADEWRQDGDVLVMEKIRPICLSVQISNKAAEHQRCQTCQTITFVSVRSIEDTFWCRACNAWKPCAPKRS